MIASFFIPLIQALEGKPIFIEMAGNLVPVQKSGDQLHLRLVNDLTEPKGYLKNNEFQHPNQTNVRSHSQRPLFLAFFPLEDQVFLIHPMSHFC